MIVAGECGMSSKGVLSVHEFYELRVSTVYQELLDLQKKNHWLYRAYILGRDTHKHIKN